MGLFEEYLTVFAAGLRKQMAVESSWYGGRVMYVSFSPYLYRRTAGGPACDWAGSVAEVEEVVRMLLPPGMTVAAREGVVRGDYQLEICRPTPGRVPSWA